MDLDDRQKKLAIGGIVLLLIATVLTLYFVFFPPTPSEEASQPTFGETSGSREGLQEDRENDRAGNTGVFSSTARLRLLSEEPVAGATTLSIDRVGDAESQEVVRYNERATAHAFDVELEDLEKERISNTTIPRIYESLWTNDGTRVILRYLDDDNQTITTYSAGLVEEEEQTEGKTPYRLEGNFLSNNIMSLVVSPDTSEIFWITKTLQESQGTISNPDGSNSRVLFTSPFTEWLPQWYIAGALALTTKASGYVDGFSYSMQLSTGELNRTLGDVTGLTTLTSPSGQYVLYSKGTTRTLSTHLLNTETDVSSELSISTLPEKCVWESDDVLYCGVPGTLSSGVYPDIWYQGKILFNDNLYAISPETGRATFLYSPENQDEEIIDVYKPLVSESGEYLIFNNKHDMSLWAFTINQREELNLPSPDEVLGL